MRAKFKIKKKGGNRKKIWEDLKASCVLND